MRCQIFGDFLSWVVSKSNRKVCMQLCSFASSVASDCHFHSQIYFFTWFKHFDIVKKTRKVSVHAPIVVRNLLTVRQERNVTCYLDWSDHNKLVTFQTTTFLKKKESQGGIEPRRPFCFKPALKLSCRLPLAIPPDNGGKGVGLWMGLGCEWWASLDYQLMRKELGQ